MRIRDIEGRVVRKLNCGSWDLKITLGIVATAAIASLLRMIYLIGYMAGQDSLDPYSEAVSDNDFPYILNGFRLAIVVGLVVAAVGLWSRKAYGFFLSIIALVWAGVGYVRWYNYSVAFLRNVEVSGYADLHSPELQHTGGLHGATWWDVAVLGAVAMLLLWHMWLLVKILMVFERDGAPSSGDSGSIIGGTD